MAAKSQQETQKLAVTASSKVSPLRWLTQGNPTNCNMLLFRTMNRQDADNMFVLLAHTSSSKS